MTLRKSWYAAFYRKKPGATNIMNVVMESWSLGLSSGYILARFIKLMSITILYIARIDTPFLAEGVGFDLDKAPFNFRKDILLHEAVSS